MYQIKLSLQDSQVEFLGRHRAYGFRDRSELVRKALEFFQREIEQRELEESASLYAQLYEEDDEAKQWVAGSAEDWPR